VENNLAMEAIDRQQWLDSTADTVQGAVQSAFEGAGEGGRAVKNFLHGTWLGHPLHPVLTDIPLGAWTAALVMDGMEELTGRKEFGTGADAAVAVGLAGAAAAALAGITDWQATHGHARRVGLAHGLLNTGGVVLYAASLTARGRGDRAAGRGLSLLGFAVAGCSAWLGGDLVFAEKIGVDHADRRPLPKDFKAVLADSELAEGQMRRVDVEGVRVLLARCNGRVHAIGEVCSHLGGPLSEGEFKDCSVRCPWHGSRFSIEDGRVLDGPATRPESTLEVRIREGQIEVRATPNEE
jgi:nitrite reductase/ring-hydroxylating ferredoxin subunit/uncharacterized membrane protein